MDTSGIVQIARNGCPGCAEPSPTGKPEFTAAIAPGSVKPSNLATIWASDGPSECFFDYWRCESCGLLHNAVQLHPDLVADCYSQMNDNTAGEPLHLLRATQQRYIAAMEEIAPLAGNYLEIGPDIGLATEIAVQRGNFTTVALVEPNKASHASLRQVMQSQNTVIVESLSDLDISVQVDRLVLIHVLDHLLFPRKDLLALRHRMSDGGLLLVVVHDESSLLRRMLGRRWPPFRLQHPQLFSRRSLTGLLESTGFSMRSIHATSNTLSIRHLVRSGFSAIGLEPRWVRRVPEIGLTVRLGNIAAVAEAT